MTVASSAIIPRMVRISVIFTAVVVSLSLAAQPLHLGTPQPISVARLGMSGGRSSSPVIGSNGQSFLVAWADDRGSSKTSATWGKAIRVGADGVPLDEVAIATQHGSPFGVVWTGSEWIVAGSDGLARVSAGGELIGSRTSAEWSNHFHSYGLAWTGDAAMVIGTQFPEHGGNVIGLKVIRLDRELNVLSTEMLTDGPTTPIGFAGDGQSAVAVYREYIPLTGLSSIRAASFGRDGLLRKKVLMGKDQSWLPGSLGSTGKGYVLVHGIGATSQWTFQARWIDRELALRTIGTLGIDRPITSVRNLVWDGSRLTYYATVPSKDATSKLVAVHFTENGSLTIPAVETVTAWNGLYGPEIAAASVNGKTLLGHLTCSSPTSGPSALKLRAFGAPSGFAAAAEASVEHGAFQQETFGAASNTDGSLVAWHERTAPDGPWAIYATRLTREAKVADPDSLFVGGTHCSGMDPAVATDGRDFLVAWHDQQKIAVALVRADGTSQKTHTISGLTALCDQRPLRLVSNGTDYLLLWRNKDPKWEKWKLHGLRLRGDGTPIDATPITIADWTEHEGVSITAASNGQDYLVAWNNRARRVTSSGAVLDRSDNLRLGAGGIGQLWWNGATYVAQTYVARTYENVGGLDFMRIGSDGTGGRSPYGPQPGPIPWPPDAAGGTGGTLPVSMACDAKGCSGPKTLTQPYGPSVVRMLRFDDDGTNMTVNAQVIPNFSYDDRDDEFATHRAGAVDAGRLAILYLARPKARPYSNARRLFVAPVAAPRPRAVSHR